MGVIRGEAIAGARGGAVRLDLGDLARRGEQIRELARAESAAIIAEAKAERARILAGAKDEGFAQGLEEGRREGARLGAEEGRSRAAAAWEERIRTACAAIESAAGGVAAAREAALRDARRDMLGLAILLAERVVKRTIEIDPEVVRDQLAAVIAAVAKRTDMVVSVHPDDEETARECIPGLAQRLAGGSTISIQTDTTLTRGSAVVRTAGGGEIDGRVDEQLRRIAETLLPERPSASAKERGP